MKKRRREVSTPLALALRSSSATRRCAAASRGRVGVRGRGRPRPRRRSSSVSVSERVISVMCARQKLSGVRRPLDQLRGAAGDVAAGQRLVAEDVGAAGRRARRAPRRCARWRRGSRGRRSCRTRPASIPAAAGRGRGRAPGRPDGPASAGFRSSSLRPADRPRLLPPPVLLQPRHDLHEIAGLVPVVELRRQDAVPGVPAGPGRARQREEIGPPRHPGAGPALHRGGADLPEGDQREQRPEGRRSPSRRPPVRLHRHVAPGEPGAAGRDRPRPPPGRRPTPAAAPRSPPARPARSPGPASTCPAAVSRSTSRSPERSSAGPRLSDTVSTAIRTGTNAALVTQRPRHRAAPRAAGGPPRPPRFCFAVAQQRRRMVGRHHRPPRQSCQRPRIRVIPRRSPSTARAAGVPEQQHHLGSRELDMAEEEGQQHRRLVAGRVAVLRRPPRQHVGDVGRRAPAPRLSRQPDRREHPVEELPRRARRRAARPGPRPAPAPRRSPSAAPPGRRRRRPVARPARSAQPSNPSSAARSAARSPQPAASSAGPAAAAAARTARLRPPWRRRRPTAAPPPPGAPLERLTGASPIASSAPSSTCQASAARSAARKSSVKVRAPERDGHEPRAAAQRKPGPLSPWPLQTPPLSRNRAVVLVNERLTKQKDQIFHRLDGLRTRAQTHAGRRRPCQPLHRPAKISATSITRPGGSSMRLPSLGKSACRSRRSVSPGSGA